MFESPFHFTVDVVGWARHLDARFPSGHFLHAVAYAAVLGVVVLSWRIIQAEIKQQERKGQ
jgi:hypothetical protein|eukprot:COSAG02_NODE_1615_length_11668_cov_6.226294_7_plen_61_part_00